MRAETTPETTSKPNRERREPRVLMRTLSQRLVGTRAPERSSPALRMYIAATVIVAGLPNPAKASRGVARPRTITSTRTIIATRSTRNTSVRKRMTERQISMATKTEPKIPIIVRTGEMS